MKLLQLLRYLGSLFNLILSLSHLQERCPLYVRMGYDELTS